MLRCLFTVMIALASFAVLTAGASAHAFTPAALAMLDGNLKLSYHEISAFPSSPNGGSNGDSPIASEDGQHVAYAMASSPV